MGREDILGKLGIFESHYNEEEKLWHIDWIESRENGGSSKLVKEWVDKVGPGEQVTVDCVIEPETVKKLDELITFDDLAENERYTFEDRKIIEELKIVKVIEKGGIRINLLTIEKISLESQNKKGKIANIQISLRGCT